MEGHTIRLRGGWDALRANEPTTEPVRIALPASPGTVPAAWLLLRRRFGRPLREPGASAILRISAMPGLRSVTFNGRPVVAGSPGGPDFEAELGPLLPRNELILDAHPPADATDWGDVRLILGGERSIQGTLA